MSERTITMVKKTKRIMLGCCVVIVMIWVLYFTGILQKIASPKGLGDLSYLSQYAGTGLVAPVNNMVAYVDNGNQYATNTPQGKNLASQNVSGNSVAVGQSPVVLFDISSSPAGKSSTLLTLIWLGSGIVSLILLYFLIIGYFKRRKLERIKENTKV